MRAHGQKSLPTLPTHSLISKHESSLGFTLIELSIVLVIIGLIVGGVLIGRDLIEAAKIRASIKQIEGFNAAVNAFKLRYVGIPGDIRNGVNFGFSPRYADGNGRGNGNYVIESDYQTTSYSYEIYGTEKVLFWNDLTRAGLIQEGLDPTVDYTLWSCGGTNALRCYPKLKLTNDHIYIINRAGQHFYFMTRHAYLTNVTAEAALTPSQMFSWDTKVDDGIPTTGIVTSVAVGAAFAVLDTNTSGTTCMSSTTTYNFTGSYANNKLCSVKIAAPF